MTTSDHYKSNLRDTFFNLFEVLEIGEKTLGRGSYTSLDEATVREILTKMEGVCRKDLGASFANADRTPLTLDADGNVTLPESLKRSLQAYYDGGWHLLELPEHLGGMGAPPSVIWSAFEMMSGSNPPATIYFFGVFIAKIIDRLGTAEQKARFLKPMIDGCWGGTMVLTEPDAGSDVGAGRTKARHLHDDVWAIEGVKRFITNGDFDGPANIVHLVLARPEGASVGTKGLSLFIVPKFMVNDDGSLGERNGVYCTNLEKKMGIKSSATCEMTFGERGLARGFLVGNVHQGIRQMFHVIEQARMAVGMKSMATLSTAYLHALAYTKERIQGPDLLQIMDKTSPRVEIIRHPDVRRMLMSQKAHAEGLRALCLYAAFLQDQVELLGGHGHEMADALDRRNDFLLPLIKGYASEKAYEQLAISLQCFGGSGYLQDYPIEQYIRDQKIDSLYEGTTHIQALDLFFRKIARDGGATLRELLAEIAQVAKERADDHFRHERSCLANALRDVEAITQIMFEKVAESFYHVGFQGNRILFALAELVIAWRLFIQAEIALRRKDENPADADFYQGKMASATFFATQVLPALAVTRHFAQTSSLDLMALPDASF